jgi:hypothetical protein
MGHLYGLGSSGFGGVAAAGVAEGAAASAAAPTEVDASDFIVLLRKREQDKPEG